MNLDPNKTYLVWNGTEFPNSTKSTFRAPDGSTIDWGDGTVETFDTASTTKTTHTYTDGKTEHTIVISGLTSIGNYAFEYCSNLTSVTIGNGVTNIGLSAFYDCKNLISITIPDSITIIYNQAFAYCSSLTSVTIGSGVTKIDNEAFRGCSKLTNITIPDSLTNIGNYVFRDCSGLTSVTIGNNVTSLGVGMFYDCSSLTSVNIPYSVTGIGNSAFHNCSKLTSITIPDSVTSIGSFAFENCTKLIQLILFPSTPPTLGSNAIPATIQSIYVQQSSKDAYQKATNWNSFASKIVSDNIYLSFVRFNTKNKEYIDSKTNGLSTIINLENGAGEVLIQTTDTNQSFKVMTDGRAKVQSAPTENDDVVRKLELVETLDEIATLKSDIGVKNVSITEITGHYINKYGEDKTSENFNMSTPITIGKGQIIEFTASGYSTNISMIALSDSSGTSFTPAVISIDGTERKYTYTALDNGYFVVSYQNIYPKKLIVYENKSNAALNNRVTVIEDSGAEYLGKDSHITVTADKALSSVSETGKYIRYNGNKSSSAAFGISVPISLTKGQRITFNAVGESTVVAILAEQNSDSTYTPLIVSTDSIEHDYEFMATKDMNVVISSNLNYAVIYSIFSSRIDTNDIRITALERDCFAFATMGVIGDSLASGASNYSGGSSDRPNYSWGKYIEREHGINVSLFSRGGGTTRSWLTASWGITALQNANILDCYIIGLGVNDAYSLGAEYLGTSADVHVGNEELNADTYYGNYSKIISVIKAKSPRAKVMCLTNPKASNATELAYNQAVKDIVAMYTNTYLIDLKEDSFYESTDFNATWNVAHSTALGYKLISENIYNHISELIRNNMSDFLDIQWIVENHA